MPENGGLRVYREALSLYPPLVVYRDECRVGKAKLDGASERARDPQYRRRDGCGRRFLASLLWARIAHHDELYPDL